MYQNFIIPYLYEAQHVSGDTLPIIRSLKLHWQPLVFHNTAKGCWTCSWWTLSGKAMLQYYKKHQQSVLLRNVFINYRSCVLQWATIIRQQLETVGDF